MVEELPENPVILEVGSHVGDWIGRMLKARQDVEIYGIEPSPENFKKLKKDYGKVDRLHLFKFFIGAHCFDTMYVHPDSRSHCGLKKVAKHKSDKYEKISVRSMSLGYFFSQREVEFDFIRLDCYGGEYEIFENGLDWLDKVNYIQITFHVKPSPFNKPAYREKRKKIFKVLNKKFEMILGEDIKDDKKHIHQLWRKRASI